MSLTLNTGITSSVATSLGQTDVTHTAYMYHIKNWYFSRPNR